jgi:geranylgeranyl pyrophosphate synthase
MSSALSPEPPRPGQSMAQSTPWVLLPCWCCQSAGGGFCSATPVAAAWGLLYAASHILDDVEDGDVSDSFGPHSGASRMLNASTGLIVSVPLILRELCHQEVSEALIGELVADFHLSAIRMCGGQHCDLTQAESSLESAWQIAELKSGGGFALACRAGARLATDKFELLEAYTRFGHHLGMLIQIADDAGGLWSTEGHKSDLVCGSEGTLPAAYAMSVLPQEGRARLRTCLQAAKQSPAAEAEARCLIEGAGAGLYLAAKATEHHRKAKAALEKACPPSYAREKLMDLLGSTIASSLC